MFSLDVLHTLHTVEPLWIYFSILSLHYVTFLLIDSIFQYLLNEDPLSAILRDENEERPIHMVARIGRVDMLKLALLSSPTQFVLNNKNDTPLSLACAKGHLDCVRILLERKDIERTINHRDADNVRNMSAFT